MAQMEIFADNEYVNSVRVCFVVLQPAHHYSHLLFAHSMFDMVRLFVYVC